MCVSTITSCTHGTHKIASDDKVKLDGSLTQHCLEKNQALNVDDDDYYYLICGDQLTGIVRPSSSRGSTH